MWDVLHKVAHISLLAQAMVGTMPMTAQVLGSCRSTGSTNPQRDGGEQEQPSPEFIPLLESPEASQEASKTVEQKMSRSQLCNYGTLL